MKYNLVVSGYWDVFIESETDADAIAGRGSTIQDTRNEVDWEIEEVIREDGLIVWSKDEDRIGKKEDA